MTAKILRPTFKKARVPNEGSHLSPDGQQLYIVPLSLAVMYSQWLKVKGHMFESLESTIRHAVFSHQEVVHVSEEVVEKCRISVLRMYADIGLFFVPTDPSYAKTDAALRRVDELS